MFKKMPFLIKVGITFIVLAIISVITHNLNMSYQKERIASIEQSVKDAAIQCYVAEGVYPPKVEYLESHYGLMINHDKFIVDYRCYATNQIPLIKVIAR